MNRRKRRSSDPRTALHLFLEGQLAELGARSLRVTTVDGDMIAAVGNDAYADDWVATWSLRVRTTGDDVIVASSGGRASPSVELGVRRLVG